MTNSRGCHVTRGKQHSGWEEVAGQYGTGMRVGITDPTPQRLRGIKPGCSTPKHPASFALKSAAQGRLGGLVG